MTPLLASPGDDATWDARLAPALGHPFQSIAFGAAMSLRGWRVLRFDLFDGVPLVGQCQVLIRDGAATWYHGPVVARALEADAIAALRVALATAGVRRVVHATTQAGYFAADAATVPGAIRGETPYVDLRVAPEELLRRWDRSIRKNVARCEAEGVSVAFTADEAALADYLPLLRAHRRHLRLAMPPFYPDRDSLSAFDGAMEIAIASARGEPLGALGLVRSGAVVAEVAVARAETALPVHDLIKLRAVERYHARGLAVYDLMGVDPDPAEGKGAGIRRFKLKFATGTAGYSILAERGTGGLALVRRVIARMRRPPPGG